MTQYRDGLPQLSGELYLTDAGLETDLIFNHGIEIREFAAHTLLQDEQGREALKSYLEGFLALADEQNTGFILDTQTWKAHVHWAGALGATESELREANEEAVRFVAKIRDKGSARNKLDNLGPKCAPYWVAPD